MISRGKIRKKIEAITPIIYNASLAVVIDGKTEGMTTIMYN
jgi:hypothetical protein